MTTQVLLYTQDPTKIKQIHDSLINHNYFLFFANKREEIEIVLKNNRKMALLLDINEMNDGYQYCETLSLLYPEAFIILVGDEQELNLINALRSGANDVLSYTAEEDAIVEVLNRVEKHFKLKETQAMNKEQDQNGLVITACSTKGGVGKTTLIVNLASVLSNENLKVAVLDLSLQFGDVSLYYDVKPKKTIYEWVKEEYGVPNTDLSKYMIKHSSGVDIFPAPIRPEFSEAITEEHIHDLIQQCRRLYDYILIDTPPYLTEHTLISLEKSNEILLMTFMDLPTLKNNKIFIETLEALNLKYKVRIILNRYYKVKGIHPETVEKIFELPIFAQIPNKEKDITASINEGKPYALTNPNSAFSKSIKFLARKLIGSPNEINIK
ncbi:AAA family ATPase [Ureibacillus acetophenoni]|uniref:Pilus assembly protein CpaE n=1 Tax=Ureibacillus acetophenoni TaxID=614649 RepID=A0A285U9N7_9BACL|nr:AAA family ATPase [Ureibacillus acetophenoni]SOC37266.1 pilus assembly protein CpaE [Ureibacillus acetophenoni]